MPCYALLAGYSCRVFALAPFALVVLSGFFSLDCRIGSSPYIILLGHLHGCTDPPQLLLVLQHLQKEASTRNSSEFFSCSPTTFSSLQIFLYIKPPSTLHFPEAIQMIHFDDQTEALNVTQFIIHDPWNLAAPKILRTTWQRKWVVLLHLHNALCEYESIILVCLG